MMGELAQGVDAKMRVMEPNTADEVVAAARGAFDAAAFANKTLETPASLAAVLDHTLLKPEATRDQVLAVCREAAEHHFACAMVNPTWVPLATSILGGTGVPVGVVIGFPLGANLSTTKRDEAREMVKLGARELDMVAEHRHAEERFVRSGGDGHPFGG